MPDQPERDIEKQLRASAERRRVEAGGPFEMREATRRVLHGEVARRYGRSDSAESESRLWWAMFWPRLAFGASLAVILGLCVWTYFLSPPQTELASKESLQEQQVASVSKPATPAERTDKAKLLADAYPVDVPVPVAPTTSLAPTLAMNTERPQSTRARDAAGETESNNAKKPVTLPPESLVLRDRAKALESAEAPTRKAETADDKSKLAKADLASVPSPNSLELARGQTTGDGPLENRAFRRSGGEGSGASFASNVTLSLAGAEADRSRATIGPGTNFARNEISPSRGSVAATSTAYFSADAAGAKAMTSASNLDDRTDRAFGESLTTQSARLFSNQIVTVAQGRGGRVSGADPGAAASAGGRAGRGGAVGGAGGGIGGGGFGGGGGGGGGGGRGGFAGGGGARGRGARGGFVPLQTFRVEQAGNAVKIVDADDSVYEGAAEASPTLAQRELRTTPAQPTPTPSLAPLQKVQFSFTVAGTNRSLQQRVVFDGQMQPVVVGQNLELKDAAAQLGVSALRGQFPSNAPSASPNAPAPAERSRIVGRAVVGENRQLEVDAISTSK